MNYVQKPLLVIAEQFHAAVTPWPVPVHLCDSTADVGITGPHLHNGLVVVVNEGDWIVTDVYTGLVRVIPDAEFSARFELAPVGREVPAGPPRPPDIYHHLR